MQDVLQVGERLTAMVLLSEAQGRRLNLSTAHLELLAGDMLHDRRAVYATAAQQAAIIRAQMYQQVRRGGGTTAKQVHTASGIRILANASVHSCGHSATTHVL